MIKLSTRLYHYRKKEQKTQQEVAQYIGLSTAAVSKWENGQSYPDIMILPKLATYFNVSVDDLLGYEPQMTKENIQKLYGRLAVDLQQKEFSEVYFEIQKISQEYYSCFPLLVQLSALLLNYSHLFGENAEEIKNFINNLCKRVQNESKDLKQQQLARSIEVQLALLANKPETVIQLLNNNVQLYLGNDLQLANAYIQLQQFEQAEETFQASLYQNLIAQLSIMSNSLQLQITELERFEETIKRGCALIDLFDIEKLHFNSCAVFYLSVAQAYMAQQKTDQALIFLDAYRKLIEHTEFPITLHGDDYFNKIDFWILREFDLGSLAPRDDETIRQSIVQSVAANPAFATLADQPKFRQIIISIKHSLGVS